MLPCINVVQRQPRHALNIPSRLDGEKTVAIRLRLVITHHLGPHPRVLLFGIIL